MLKDIEYVGIELEEIIPELAHPASVCHSSSGRYRRFFPTITDMLWNISHHVLPIDIIFNIDLLVRLLFSVNIDIISTGVLWFEKFGTKASLVYL